MKVLHNGGSNKKDVLYGWARTDVLLDGSVPSGGFKYPLEDKTEQSGINIQNLTNVPMKIEGTLARSDALSDTAYADNAALNIWGQVSASLAKLAIVNVSHPYSGFKVSAIVAPIATTALSWLAGVVSVTSTAHGLNTGDQVTIAGVTPVEYNGLFTATRVDADHFTYLVAADPGAVTIQGTDTIVPSGAVVFLAS